MKLDPKKVRRTREMLGLSLDDVAKRAGVSQKATMRAEHGEEIRPVTARKVARGLEVEVADLYPKALAPTSSPKSEVRRAIDLSPEDFRRALSEASEVGADALIELYERLDAERTSAELAFREDEDDRAARSDYARAVERRMRLFLALLGRGFTPPDPEQLNRQIEQLEELQPLR